MAPENPSLPIIYFARKRKRSADVQGAARRRRLGGEQQPPRPEPSRPRTARSRRLVWVFRIASLIFPFACLAIVNLILYWADVGVNTSLVVSNDRLPTGMFYLNPDSPNAYYDRDLRGPEPRAFALPKGKETFRVLVVGASSVAGYPYESGLAFPRQMELVLGKQLKGKRVEVLNAGVVGIATTPLVDLVRQADDASPDVIVCYAGHNEFYGVGGVATHARLARIGIQLRHFRLGQVITGWFAGEQATEEELITQLPTTIEIPLDSPLVGKAERRYRRNLTAIANACAGKGIPLVICSVVSNLRDHSPIRSLKLSSLEDSERKIRDQAEQAANDLLLQEDYTAAYEPVLAAQTQFPDSAAIRYQLARCLEGLGRSAEAHDGYVAARDLDGCRYRAPGSFRDIAREVAAGREDEAIQFVDLAPAFANATQHAAPGHDLFLEHVHLTHKGNWLVATTIARTIIEDICEATWVAASAPTDEARDNWLAVIAEDHVVATARAIPMYEVPPFHESVCAELHVRSLNAKMQQQRAEMSELENQLMEKLNDSTLVKDLVDGLGRSRLTIGDVPAALEFFERGKRRRSFMPNSYVFAASCYYALRQHEEAASNVKKSFQTPITETDNLVKVRNELVRRMERQVGQGEGVTR